MNPMCLLDWVRLQVKSGRNRLKEDTTMQDSSFQQLQSHHHHHDHDHDHDQYPTPSTNNTDPSSDILPLDIPALSPPTNITTSVSPLQREDWSDNIPSSDHVEFFRRTNWAASQLGPLSTWSNALRLHTFMVFADSRAACVYCRCALGLSLKVTF